MAGVALGVCLASALEALVQAQGELGDVSRDHIHAGEPGRKGEGRLRCDGDSTEDRGYQAVAVGLAGEEVASSPRGGGQAAAEAGEEAGGGRGWWWRWRVLELMTRK